MTVDVELEIAPTSTGFCKEFDHVVFYVSSPRLVAKYFINVFGFSMYAYKGLETGSTTISASVVQNGKVTIVFMGAIGRVGIEQNDGMVEEIHTHIASHGEGVKDVAFTSTNLESFLDTIKRKNSTGLLLNYDTINFAPTVVEDEYGTLKFVTIKSLNDTLHTLVDRSNYRGFLPGYTLAGTEWKLENRAGSVKFDSIDHCVQNVDWNKMLACCAFYRNYLNFHIFWSVDERQISTPYSALKSTVMASEGELIKMPINEPALGLKKSQIEEFLEFNNGAGIQHIALKVDNMVETIKRLKLLGVEFIGVPDKYYDNLEKKLKTEKHPQIRESFKSIKKLGILVDFDEHGYLLQLFTKPIFERPTFFFEIIQRSNHNGFGAGNFKSLFEVLENDQQQRGNLTDQSPPH